ncbi:hypothetical protein WKH15_21660 [Pantoea agglomerans]|jgi:hypothetical protein|uniref:hypothetical protein n=1 Tax=Enterobacter agglomerans TaxID=549 RepID=UPI003C7DC617
MSSLSYVKNRSGKSTARSGETLDQLISRLPQISVAELESMTTNYAQLVEQLPRYLSEMVGYECRLIGF